MTQIEITRIKDLLQTMHVKARNNQPYDRDDWAKLEEGISEMEECINGHPSEVDINIKNAITLIETCGACPEQYDAFIDNKQVGYLRLRHGFFYVDCPACGGETVYEAHPAGDGCFDSDERDLYLNAAKDAISKWVSKHQITPRTSC